MIEIVALIVILLVVLIRRLGGGPEGYGPEVFSIIAGALVILSGGTRIATWMLDNKQ